MPAAQHCGHTLTWEEHSGGGHTFIFIHGFSAPRQTWQPVVERFAGLGRCVTLDLPGHGLAQVPPGYVSLTQDDLLDLETQAVREICGAGTATLIGHSTGGLVALGVAARLPGQVVRAVSIDGVVWGPLTGLLGVTPWFLRRGIYLPFWAGWGFTQLAPWAMMFGMTFYVHDQRALWRSAEMWRLCREAYPIYRRQPLRHLATLLRMLDTCDVRPVVAGLATPALIITGTDDPVVPPAQAEWLAHNLACAELCAFPGAGHVPHMEAAAACENAIKEWLAR